MRGRHMEECTSRQREYFMNGAVVGTRSPRFVDMWCVASEEILSPPALGTSGTDDTKRETSVCFGGAVAWIVEPPLAG